MDTSSFSVGKLRSELLDLFGRERDRQGLARGRDELRLQARPAAWSRIWCLTCASCPIPTMCAELKNGTGLDAAVRDYVFSFHQTTGVHGAAGGAAAVSCCPSITKRERRCWSSPWAAPAAITAVVAVAHALAQNLTGRGLRRDGEPPGYLPLSGARTERSDALCGITLYHIPPEQRPESGGHRRRHGTEHAAAGSEALYARILPPSSPWRTTAAAPACCAQDLGMAARRAISATVCRPWPTREPLMAAADGLPVSPDGTLAGQSLGNLLLAALNDIYAQL